MMGPAEPVIDKLLQQTLCGTMHPEIEPSCGAKTLRLRQFSVHIPMDDAELLLTHLA